MSKFIVPTRRAFLTGAVTTAAGLVSGFPINTALAKAPMTNKQVPAFYRFKVGAFEATVVTDGPLHLGPPSGNLFNGVSKEEITQVLANNYLSTTDVALEQNALVINTGKQLVLFDTGLGNLKMMGNDSGRLLASLKAAGINPKNIDVIALTHAHPDHCFGLMMDKGARNFPNAQIYMTQADFDFWTDEGKMSNDQLKPLIAGARKNLLPNRSRMVFIKDGQEIVPGIQAMAASGHTVGHTIFMITSSGQSLCNVADIAHHHVLSVERPRLEFAYDTDGKQGVASRLRVFDMLASTRTQLIAYHFPWPGIGYVGKQGDGFRYFAAPTRTSL